MYKRKERAINTPTDMPMQKMHRAKDMNDNRTGGVNEYELYELFYNVKYDFKNPIYSDVEKITFTHRKKKFIQSNDE